MLTKNFLIKIIIITKNNNMLVIKTCYHVCNTLNKHNNTKHNFLPFYPCLPACLHNKIIFYKWFTGNQRQFVFFFPAPKTFYTFYLYSSQPAHTKLCLRNLKIFYVEVGQGHDAGGGIKYINYHFHLVKTLYSHETE